MKQKFFRIEWEGEDDIDENEVSIALSSWFDRHYDVRNPPIEEIEAFEISDKVFEDKKDTDCCSVTTKHNYQPPICVNCGKEKPKKVMKLPKLCSGDWILIEKINELIEVVNR